MTGAVLPGAGPPVIDCPGCHRLTYVLDACPCTSGGDRMIVDAGQQGDGKAYQDCQLCRGVGTLPRPCHRCRQAGRLRGQLVLSVANVDSGAVASANVVPGVVEPAPWPGDGGTWHLPLAPILAELAASVGAGCWVEARNPPGSPDGPLLLLPSRWRPDLPSETRAALEAEAIASHGHLAWQLYLGRTAAEPLPDPARDLVRRCRLADLLRLDLVLEARRRHPDADPTWQLRYEVPGGPVPNDVCGGADDLTGAIVTTTDLDALYDLEARGRTAPAHYLTGGVPPPAGPPDVDLDQLERRMLADCTDLCTGAPTAGAQAIWRDRRWWHTSLRIAGTAETFSEWDTGQIHLRETSILRRGWQPPTPSWQGPSIPYVDCPHCDPHSRLRRCDCVLFTGRADPDCPQCSGAGRRPSALPCDTCRDSHRIHHSLTVTLTDLADRVTHLHWQVDRHGWRAGDLTWHGDAHPSAAGEQGWQAGERISAPHVATQPGGKPVHQLPDPFRLATWAGRFGVRPDDLTELDGGGSIGQGLLDGTVTVPYAGADPLAEHLRQASRGRPGARLFVLARRPDVPPLADLVRLLLGLRLTVTVTLVDHGDNAGDPRLVQGEGWDVGVEPPGLPVAPDALPVGPTPEAAIARCLEHLEIAVARRVPDDPAQPIPVPQTPVPVEVDDPVPLIRRLARQHVGQPVAVHYAGLVCQLLLHDRDGVRRLCTAPTLPGALAALGLDRR
ncbi:hypothetical protein [Plantactinospora sp. WMMB782]|uniref:hypothetical protein n=1 Tax=Plantactinospora sp. WMMB782 TaxID=3404121 RepID=UPI003B93A344